MMKQAFLIACLAGLLGGCAVGGGPVVGYGKKRGFYAGLGGHAGVTAVQLAADVGATKQGLVFQSRLELEANKLRIRGWPFEPNKVDQPYPGLRAGVGAAFWDGGRGLSTVLGPDVGVMTTESSCGPTVAARMYYVGIEWRRLGDESQIVLAPRVDRVGYACWH